MSLWKWSRTAASNATADGSINYAEGQAPSSLNDAARAAMAAVAKYRDDIAGAITTGGTSTAYTLSSYQVFDTLAHMDGAMIAFVPHATSGGTSTFAVDGLTAKPLRPAPGVEFASGALVLGVPYVATYFNSSNSGEWIVHGLPMSAWASSFTSSTVLYASATALVSNTAKDITSLSLTAGDWDVYGSVGSKAGSGAVITFQTGWISTTSATEPTDPNEGAKALLYQPSGGTANAQYEQSGLRKRIVLSGTTTVYLSMTATFTGSVSGYGYIGARRESF